MTKTRQGVFTFCPFYIPVKTSDIIITGARRSGITLESADWSQTMLPDLVVAQSDGRVVVLGGAAAQDTSLMALVMVIPMGEG
jgi:hypothetical protein